MNVHDTHRQLLTVLVLPGVDAAALADSLEGQVVQSLHTRADQVGAAPEQRAVLTSGHDHNWMSMVDDTTRTRLLATLAATPGCVLAARLEIKEPSGV